MSHRYEMYSVGNIVNNYICMALRLIMVIILNFIKILDYYVMYQEIT